MIPETLLAHLDAFLSTPVTPNPEWGPGPWDRETSARELQAFAALLSEIKLVKWPGWEGADESHPIQGMTIDRTFGDWVGPFPFPVIPALNTQADVGDLILALATISLVQDEINQQLMMAINLLADKAKDALLSQIVNTGPIDGSTAEPCPPLDRETPKGGDPPSQPG